MTDPTANLIARDAAVIAGVEKLRFFPATMAAGKGAELTDLTGRKHIDLTSTWTAAGLGYGHPRVAAAVAEAYQSPPSAGLSIMHETAVRLAERLLELVAGEDDRRVYLGLAGSDACDVALRCARTATGKQTIVAFEHSYHGGFGLAQSVSGVLVEGGAPAYPHGVFVPYPDPFRPPGRPRSRWPIRWPRWRRCCTVAMSPVSRWSRSCRTAVSWCPRRVSWRSWPSW
jgi:4-aminobutyrate aminotransferase